MSSETARLQMGLVQPAQAQKHVTVNEALMRLDGMVSLVLESVSQPVPPGTVLDGQCWGVPSQAQGAWAGQAGRIALGINGGWVFVPPRRGMRAFIADQGASAIHDGTSWNAGAITLGATGAGMTAGLAESVVEIAPGTSMITDAIIPPGAMVIGVTARVMVGLTGSLTSWRMGTAGAGDRFGTGLGIAQGSWAQGVLGTPMTYYQPEPIILAAEGGAFATGRIRLAVHWLELRLPA